MSSNPSKYDVCVVGGAGHVGLPLSIVFANHGLKTLIYDINEKSLERIGEGKIPFIEHGAENNLKRALVEERLSFSSKISDLQGIPNIIITIGTPVDEFLNPVTRLLSSCMDQFLPYLSDDQLLILRSTVTPGVTAWLTRYLEAKGKRPKIAFCPERVVQGYAVEEIQSLPQIVSGQTPEAEKAATELFQRISPKIVPMAPAEAEFAKLFCNVYRYIQFAASNQFYMLASNAGLDYARIQKGMTQDYQRMRDFPSAGFAAGPCLFKDTMQLASFSNNQFSLGFDAMAVNEGLPLYLVEKLRAAHDLSKMTVGLLGMAFKANNDDTRSSLSYKLKKMLQMHAAQTLTTDPHVTTDAELLTVEQVIEKSDLLILCVPHKAYKDLHLSGKTVVDIWNFFGKGARIDA